MFDWEATLILNDSLLAAVQGFAQQHLGDYLRDLREVVAIDSGTYNRAGVDRVGDWLAARFGAYGWETERLPAGDYADCRTATLRGNGNARLLLIGHMDTVYPDGTAAARPVTIEGDVLKGPGTADMKAGLLSAVYALRALQEARFTGFDRISLFCNSDEEVSSVVSRKLYRPIAAESDAALVFECARENGDLVSARKGGGRYRIQVAGKCAHAGVAPETGANAIVQLARLVDAAARLNGLRSGVTVNAGVIWGGVRPNVVPDFAEAELDVRAADREGEAAVHAALHALEAQITVSGTRVTVLGRFSGSVMEKTPGNALLARIASTVGRALGFGVKDGPMTGGRSDANYVAEVGVPVLDGLGPIGGADHGPDEYILVSSIADRIALAAGVIATACDQLDRLRELRPA